MVDVGLQESMAFLRPSELSVSQRQRIAIARAISTDPKLIIADEAVASLDMSARGQILNLLQICIAPGFFLHIYLPWSIYGSACVWSGSGDVSRSNIRNCFGRWTCPAPRAYLHSGFDQSSTCAGSLDWKTRVRFSKIINESFLKNNLNSCAYLSSCDFANDRCAVEMPHLMTVDDHIRLVTFLKTQQRDLQN